MRSKPFGFSPCSVMRLKMFLENRQKMSCCLSLGFIFGAKLRMVSSSSNSSSDRFLSAESSPTDCDRMPGNISANVLERSIKNPASKETNALLSLEQTWHWVMGGHGDGIITHTITLRTNLKKHLPLPTHAQSSLNEKLDQGSY